MRVLSVGSCTTASIRGSCARGGWGAGAGTLQDGLSSCLGVVAGVCVRACVRVCACVLVEFAVHSLDTRHLL